MRVFTVDCPLLKVEPLFILDCSYEAMQRYVRRRFRVRVDAEDRENLTAGRMFTFACAPWRLVWAKTLEPGPVLHETFHLVTRICQDKGIVIRAHNERGDNDDETAAYLFEFLATRALRRCRR